MPQSGREVVIVEAVRTPIGRGHREKGYYKDVHANALLAKAYTEVIERAGIDPSEVEDVVAGCVQQLGELVEGVEQPVAFAEVADFLDDPDQRALGADQRRAARRRDLDAHAASVALVGDPAQPLLALESGHQGRQGGALDRDLGSEFAGALRPVAQEQEQPVLGQAEPRSAAGPLEDPAQADDRTDRSGSPFVGMRQGGRRIRLGGLGTHGRHTIRPGRADCADQVPRGASPACR